MQVLPEDFLVYVDVGGLGGLKYDFPMYPKQHSILFEPNPSSLPQLSNCQIVCEALGDEEKTSILYITQSRGCCSLLPPNFGFLNNFSVKPAFEIVDIEHVKVTKYKTLYEQGVVPLPDVLKIDVQGSEYQVLQGFEELLHNVVAIELEAHLHPIYQNQKLLHDIVEYLHEFGFMCKSLQPVDHWDGHIVEFDAVFTKTPQALAALNKYAEQKLLAVLHQWGLPPNQATFHPGWIF